MVHLVIITGLSGSGKSTAKKCFEDMGYFTIDNLPVPLMSEFLRLLVHANEGIKNIAMVMDARISEFIGQLPTVLESLRTPSNQITYKVEMIYLDTSDEVLARRFSETRRKHPLSPNDSPTVGIAKERSILSELREKSDWVVDTSEYNIHQFKQLLYQRYMGISSERQLAVRITSFGYRYGIPRDADLVFDVRFLPNPFFKNEMRDLTGLDAGVRDYVLNCEQGKEFQKRLYDMLDYLLPRYQEEGKAYLNIALGCTGGKHRSVALAHALEAHLKPNTTNVLVEDRDIHKVER